MSIRYQHAGGEHEVDLRRSGTGWTALVDGREIAVDVRPDGDGCVDVRLDGRHHRAYVARDGDERWVFLAGRTLLLRRREPGADAAEELASAGPDLVADMPGKVVKLLVVVGQTVAAGQPLIILESMKMETELAAPVAGEVVRIHVEPGQTVGQRAPLVDVEPVGE